MKLVLTCNTIGPEGVMMSSGDDVPDVWPDWFVEDLKKSGGAVDAEVNEEDLDGSN